MSILIIDQNLVGHLTTNSKEATKWFNLIENLTKNDALPTQGQVTLAGTLELLGFKFQPTKILRSVTAQKELTFLETKDIVDNSEVTFKKVISGQEYPFKINQFKEEAIKRIENERAFHKKANTSPPLILLYDSIQDFVENISDDYLSAYWTTRAMSSQEFVNRFVINRGKFLKETLDHCIPNDIPCTRLVCSLATEIIDDKKIVGFDIDHEHLEEDAIWHLLFGKSRLGNLESISFLTLEEKIEKVLVTFCATICALDSFGVIPQSSRLESSGVLFNIKEEIDRPVLISKRTVSDFVNKYKQITERTESTS